MASASENVLKRNLDEYQIILIGAAGVGKTCIIKKWAFNEFSDEYIPTKTNTEQKEVEVRGQQCKVEILDTAGLSQFWGMRDEMIRQADGIIIVFSITDEGSFEMVTDIRTQVERNITEYGQAILVGNKGDLREQRKIDYHQSVTTAEKLNLDYIETSARSGDNIENAFFKLIESIMDKRQPLVDAAIRQSKKKDKSCSLM